MTDLSPAFPFTKRFQRQVLSVIHVETDCQKMSSGKVGGRRRITSLLRGAAIEGCVTMVTGAGVMQLEGVGEGGRKSVMDWAVAAEIGKAE